ncbi:SCO2400 family protein [Streptomyces sp. FR-108]|uniref:SCO2400 family protein n=1 Tax=Streptomyces sp. FR-108 TaxID=3416665 RepID=UPI003CFA7AC3
MTGQGTGGAATGQLRKTLMDYCSSCRRHLNGALVCPGCGAYAPDIAPVTVGRSPVQPRVTLAAATTPAARVPDALDSPSHGTYDGDSEGQGGGEGVYDHDGFPGATPAPQGRAARRRQRARWKKNQRRAVVATAVALVGGGLTFTAMDRLSADRAEAASAPEAAGLGANTRTNAGSAQEEETRYTRPPSTRPDAGRPSADASTRSPASGRSTVRGSVAPSSVAPQGSRPDASAPDTASASDRWSRSAASGSSADSSSAASSSSSSSSQDAAGGTAPQPSAPADSDGTSGSGGSGGTGGSDQATSPASPSPSATSPSQLCLLVLCVG